MTPHREVLIRVAQDAFQHERLRLEASRVEVSKRLASAATRLERAAEELARADRELVEASRPPTETELTQRRSWEGRRSGDVVRSRRKREHAKRATAIVTHQRAAQRERDAADVSLAGVEEEWHTYLDVTYARVLRVHEHIQRRIATYRRRLVRSHPDGPWVNRAMGVLQPQIPGWGTAPRRGARSNGLASRRRQRGAAAHGVARSKRDGPRDQRG